MYPCLFCKGTGAVLGGLAYDTIGPRKLFGYALVSSLCAGVVSARAASLGADDARLARGEAGIK